MAKGMLHKARVWLVAVATFLLLMFGFIWLTAPSNPKHNGKRLSEHLTHLTRPRIWFGQGMVGTATLSQTDRPKWESSRAAVIELGAKCIPLLQSWLQSPSRAWQAKAAAGLAKVGIQIPELAVDRQIAACDSMRIIPQHCAPLLPYLTPLFDHTNNLVAHAALTTFDSIAREPSVLTAAHPNPDLDELLGALTNSRPSVQIYSAALLRAMARENKIQVVDSTIEKLLAARRNTFPSAPPRMLWTPLRPDRSIDECLALLDPDHSLRSVFLLKYGSISEQAGSAWSLGLSKARPDKAIPLLQANLASTNNSVVENSAKTLGKYGAHASSAIPQLEALLAHPRPHVQKAASNALVEISHDLQTQTTTAQLDESPLSVPPQN